VGQLPKHSQAIMFSKEFRPLKRPKLGIPDYYPQDDKQKEDELTFQTLNCGFRLSPLVDSQDEIGSALKEFNQQLLNTKEYTVRVTHVVESKKRNGWVQDSQKRKVQVTKDNFFPVPLGRNRKEIASSWFQDLAGSKPLVQLAKKVPVFNKKEEIFDNLCEKDVPISRAAWYIKMTAAYTSTMTDSKLNKKKQSADPSYGECCTVADNKPIHEVFFQL